jgi:DNA topoisomerase-3
VYGLPAQRELGLVSRGLKSKDSVIRDTLVEMKRVFDAVEQRASVLEEHLEKYFPPAMAQRGLQLLSAGFSRCGQCGGMCDLKQSAGQFAQKSLYCSTCQKSLSVPGKSAVQPHEHICPICSYQVLTIFNEEKQTSHTVCPYCFNHPPLQEIEDTAQPLAGGTMRCFQCHFADCVLSNK